MTTYNLNGYNYSPQPQYPHPSDAPAFLPPQSVSPLDSGSPGSPFLKSEAPNTSSKLLAAQNRASRKRVARKTCFIATAIITLLIGMTFVLMAYLCLAHKCSVSNLSLISTAPLGKVLTISQVTSHLAPVSVPIVMGLSSSLVGAKWLKSSADSSSGLNRPSPMQLGLLLSMCNGANLPAFVSSCKYIFRQKPAGDKGNLKNPPILRQSLFLLASLLTSVYLAAAADSWLHATSKSIDITTASSYSSSGARDLGREINATMCNPSTYQDGTMSQSTCGLINGGSGGNGRTLMEGLRVVSNSSSLHKVVFTDDQTAILVPQTLPSNVTYSAETLGIQTQCTSVTKQCLAPTKYSDGSLNYGSDAALNLNCPSGGVKYGNGTKQIGLCSLDDQGYCIQGWKISSNPFTAGEVITSQAYFGAEEDTFNANTGWFVHGSNGAWNVVFCNVTALEVTYTYSSSRYIVDKSVPTSTLSAQHIMTVGFMEQTPAVSYAVDGAGLQENTTFEEAYSLELSRQTLARGAYMYEAKPVLGINNELIVIGTRLQIIPLMLFVVATLIFSLQVLIISLWTIISTSGIPYVHLAALYIQNPLTAVQSLYGHPDPILTWEGDTNKRFGVESEADRLQIGPVSNGDHDQGAVFAVIKG